MRPYKLDPALATRLRRAVLYAQQLNNELELRVVEGFELRFERWQNGENAATQTEETAERGTTGVHYLANIVQTHSQTHRHTDTQTHRHTDTQAHSHTVTQMHSHTVTQRHSHARTDTQTHSHARTVPTRRYRRLPR
jgi:hypothetical protein